MWAGGTAEIETASGNKAKRGKPKTKLIHSACIDAIDKPIAGERGKDAVHGTAVKPRSLRDLRWPHRVLRIGHRA
jgi:hypothetical protein